MITRQLHLPAAAILAVALVSGCANYATNESSGSSSGYGYGKAKEVKEEPAKQTVTVNIQNFAFEPATITINAGDTVVFVNQDTAPHTATDTAGGFDTGNLTNGQSGSITLTEAGSFDYFCAIHPAMKGTIVVQ